LSRFFLRKDIMKVKVIKKSFYDNKVNKIGDIIEIREKTIPSWAEALKKSKTENAEENNENTPKEPEKKDNRIDELAKLSPDEIREKLDELLNDAIDKGIMIEFENKSDIQLIIELEESLKGKK